MKKIIWLYICICCLSCTRDSSVQTLTYSGKQSLVKYATFFDLVENEGGYELSLIDPVSKRKKLFYLGTEKPAQLPLTYTYIFLPQQRLVTLSSTHIGMLSKLNAIDHIVGISGIQYVDNPILKQRYEQKLVSEFMELNHLNPENVLKSKATSVIYSGFEGKAPANESKLISLGIQCIPNYDWCELHPLGRAEWILFFGALTGKLKEAKAYFEEVERSYLEIKSSVKSYNKKTSLLVGMLIGDMWYLPAGNSFMATLYKDAGANYLLANSKGTASVQWSFEKVFNNFKTADVWLGLDYTTKAEILIANKKYQYFTAFQKGEMYTYAHQSNYYFENVASEPHLFLADLVQILHPTLSNNKLNYYQKVNE